MASLSNKKRGTFGNQRTLTATLTMGTYATNGEALTKATLGFKRIDHIHASATGGRTFPWIASTEKIQAWAGASEVANATDLSSVSTTLFVVGV